MRNESTPFQPALKAVKDQAGEQNFRVTQHAQQEMAEENILLDEVIQALSWADIGGLSSASSWSLLPSLRRYSGGSAFAYGVHNYPPFAYNYYSVRAKAAKMGDSYKERSKGMKCSIETCTGNYESREIFHAVRYMGAVVVIDHVPAEVCSVCGDVLLAPDTVRRIERILQQSKTPASQAPVYEFA